MNNMIIIETANNMNNGVNFTNIGQKFIAQALTLAGAFNQPGDISKIDDSRGTRFLG